MDVEALTDERRLCGRRSRVVLARPCRRQVLAKLKRFAKATVAISWLTEEITYKP